MARAGGIDVRLCLLEKAACSNPVMQFEGVSFDPGVRFIKPGNPERAGGARLDRDQRHVEPCHVAVTR